MSARREWKPGDVAMVTWSGGRSRLMLRGTNGRWWEPSGSFREVHALDARPLVVIDPEDPEQVERLRQGIFTAFRADERAMGGYDDPRLADLLQAALRSLVAPPKPDEPTGRYAVVEDSDAVEWVRAELVGVAQWHSINRELSRWSEWDDIDAVKVLSEGVTA